MKCPKCGYLGFEHVDRCRNCGYDFSLTDVEAAPDLSIRTDEPAIEPLADLAMMDAAISPRIARPVSVPPSSDLPLFASAALMDQPMAAQPSAPRPPLAVRRPTPDMPRVRQPRMQTLALDLDPIARPAAALDRGDDAALGPRFAALAIDLAILAAVDAIVIYFTLQICGLTFDELGILPKVPLIAFLIVQNGGYLVAFTAGGQTLGKMAMGLKVVSAASEAQPDFGSALLRTLLWVLLAIPAGLGFLTALFSSDRRGLHDRLAHTRVVRV